MQHKEPGYVQGNVALEARIVLKRNAREDVAARAGIRPSQTNRPPLTRRYVRYAVG